MEIGSFLKETEQNSPKMPAFCPKKEKIGKRSLLIKLL
jgi:hypothetical protein